MLKNKILASSQIFLSIYHSRSIINKYIKNLDKIFKKISYFEKNNIRTPKTVSITQARSPIYSTSINKNQFYEKNLNKMFSLLE